MTTKQIRKLVKHEIKKFMAMDKSTKLLDKKYYSFLEMSKLCSVSRRTIYRWVELKLINVYKIGGRRFLKKSETDKLFKKKTDK